MIEMKADLSVMKAQIAALKAASSEARHAFVVELGGDVMQRVVAACPIDTGRMAAGFAQAANKAGLGPIPEPPIKPSKMWPRNQRRLLRQLLRWMSFKALYEREGRTKTRYYKKILKFVAQAQKQVEAQTGTSIVVRNRDRKVQLTVRSKIYGGSGELVERNGSTVAKMANLEPHAIIRERAGRLVTRMLGAARGGTAASEKAAAAYQQTLRQAAGAVVTSVPGEFVGGGGISTVVSAE